MNFGRKKNRRGNAEINLTSLIDIVFQLLIFFLLTAKFAPTPGIEVELPRSDAAKPLSETDDATIIVDQDGQLFFRGAMLSAIELKDRLSVLASEENQAQITIFADASAPHGKVVLALDAAVDAGLEPIIATGE